MDRGLARVRKPDPGAIPPSGMRLPTQTDGVNLDNLFILPGLWFPNRKIL